MPNAIACVFIGGHSIAAAIHPFTAVGGIILGIIALRKFKQDKPLYDSDPIGYARSFKYLKAGKTTAIVGISVSSAMLLVVLLIAVFATISESSRRDRMRYDDYYEDYYDDSYYYDDF